MSRKNASELWQYFEKIDGKRAMCTLCNEDYSYQATTGNLTCHLRKKHPQAYINFKKVQEEARQAENKSDDGKEKVIYLVAENPPSPVGKESPDNDSDVRSRHRRSPLFKRKLENSRNVGGREKYLIQQLTKEKIAIAEVQKELVEKELEEKTIKVLLLQEEIEHKKVMHELEREELQLKIELLKANLGNSTMRPGSESNMHNIVIVPAEQSTPK